MAHYHVAFLGNVTAETADAIERAIVAHTSEFGLSIGQDISLVRAPGVFAPPQDAAAAAAFFGSQPMPQANLSGLIDRGVPIIPVASTLTRVADEIPSELRYLNALGMDRDGAEQVALVLLECLGLLPRQRRVFVSYRRTESLHAATQLFDALSSRRFDVFLDTHGIAPAEDFQGVLWHRLCDCDVVIMLDSQNYFESRWTTAEFGRAQAKNIPVLRVGLPNVAPSRRAQTAFQLQLESPDYDASTGLMTTDAINRIASLLERARSKGHAVRSRTMFSTVKQQVEAIGGRVDGVGPRGAIHLVLSDDTKLTIMTAVGIPTSNTMQQALEQSGGPRTAVVFDHVGMAADWLAHLDWLQHHVTPVRWVKVHEVGWHFADQGGA